MGAVMVLAGLFLFREIYKVSYENIYCTLRARKGGIVMMTLREVCNIVSISRRVVQGYEEAGLVISSGKNKYGHLLYDEMAIEKIRTIRQYQEFGFTVKEIKLLVEATEDVYIEMLSNRVTQMKIQIDRLVENVRKAERMIVERNIK